MTTAASASDIGDDSIALQLPYKLHTLRRIGCRRALVVAKVGKKQRENRAVTGQLTVS
ncbi:MAG: hypothetical protein ACI87W_000188 [Halieaceae bacterium]|jgi:hypothetical protein